jgi:hypothetical protein
MRVVRSLVLWVVLLGAALGAAGCSSTAKAPVVKPTGTVTVRSGGKVVCVITLGKNGTGTCKVNTANYKPGQVAFTGSYDGGSGFKPANGNTTLTVKPAKQAS